MRDIKMKQGSKSTFSDIRRDTAESFYPFFFYQLLEKSQYAKSTKMFVFFRENVLGKGY